jgi:hypothetical protein
MGIVFFYNYASFIIYEVEVSVFMFFYACDFILGRVTHMVFMNQSTKEGRGPVGDLNTNTTGNLGHFSVVSPKKISSPMVYIVRLFSM